jgi:hypothetical protein
MIPGIMEIHLKLLANKAGINSCKVNSRVLKRSLFGMFNCWLENNGGVGETQGCPVRVQSV